MKSLVEIFIANELEKVFDRFRNAKDEDIHMLEKLIAKIETKEIKKLVVGNFDEAIKIARALEDIEDVDTILDIYIYLKNFIDISIELLIEVLEEVVIYGSAKVQNIIIYEEDNISREICKEVLEVMLEESNRWDRLLDKEMLIDYIFDVIKKSELIEELMDTSIFEELLEIFPEKVFELLGKEYYIGKIKL